MLTTTSNPAAETSEKANSLTALKDYTMGALTRISSPLASLCHQFELHFQDVTQHALPFLPHPRQSILSQFVVDPVFKHGMSCASNHSSLILERIFTLYCNIRIIHYVKHFNKRLSKGKRGAELNKDKKTKHVAVQPI